MGGRCGAKSCCQACAAPHQWPSRYVPAPAPQRSAPARAGVQTLVKRAAHKVAKRALDRQASYTGWQVNGRTLVPSLGMLLKFMVRPGASTHTGLLSACWLLCFGGALETYKCSSLNGYAGGSPNALTSQAQRCTSPVRRPATGWAAAAYPEVLLPAPAAALCAVAGRCAGHVRRVLRQAQRPGGAAGVAVHGAEGAWALHTRRAEASPTALTCARTCLDLRTPFVHGPGLQLLHRPAKPPTPPPGPP
jgi:hypothetical protein